MWKNFTLAILLIAGFSVQALAVPVTFRLNTSELGQAFTTPEVNGSFNGWCGACAPMTEVSPDIWEITIELAAGFYEYKFAADNWNIQETLTPGDPCTLTTGAFTNRTLIVSTSPIVLGTVCWAECQDCGVTPQNHDVTFRVNMNEVGDPFTTPEVNGSFNGWCGSCAPMTDEDMDGIWELTISLPTGNHEYKFSADNWNIQESLTPGSLCTITNFDFTNRFVTVGDSDLDLDPVCWGECVDCNVEPQNFDVTFKVNMNNVADPFTTPEVNGTFNDWCGSCAPMTDDDLDGIWELTINLPAGNYEYKFSADNWNIQENLTPGDPCTTTEGAFTNRYITVTENTELSAVCWESCLACEGNEEYNVTFSVNMNEVTDAFTTPEVNGTFNAWCGGCAQMSDDDMDGVWELTIPLAPGTYEFKYAADSWNIQEDLTPGTACTITADGFTNRVITVTDSDIEIGTVCWGSCVDCNGGGNTYDVTFSVNMSEVMDAFTTPEVNGTFNGWCGNCAPMSDDDMDGVWDLVIALEPGTYEFKFSADNWSIQEELTPGSPCTITQGAFTNRVFTVTDSNIDLGTVCWGSCADCDEVIPTYEVVFQVDMNDYTEAFTTPEVNGTFNGWCGNCAPMSDDDQDGIWELTIMLEEGSYEYKFSYDNWAGQEELEPGSSCTVTMDGFTNRFIEVTGDVELPAVCFASCDVCEPDNVNDLNASAIVLYPNPANDVLIIDNLGQAGNIRMIRIIETSGKVVFESANPVIEQNRIDLNTFGLADGLYMLQISGENTFFGKQFVIQH